MPLDTVSCFIIQPAHTAEERAKFIILPRGEAGELALGGHQLARGYLNRPDQTASAFIPTPYGRVYRTGDRARVTASGMLECLGRLEAGQVKLRGQRIELGEIEQVVLKTPGCYGAVAVVINSTLVVFCAADEGVTEDIALEICTKWLPRYMVPSQLMIQREFPRLPSGKVDIPKLKSDFNVRNLSLNDTDTGHVVSVHDQFVLQLVSETIGMQMNKETTLASAGVDSLMAIKLASSLRAAGFETSAPELLKMRMLSDLCSTLEGQSPTTPEGAETLDVSLLPELDQILAENPDLQTMETPVEDILPCTPLQSAMLAETAKNPETYSNEVEMQTCRGVSLDALVAALMQVANANMIYRTGFVMHRGQHLSIIFKNFALEKICLVDKFRRKFAISSPKDLLSPFGIQIQRPAVDSGPRLLLQIHHALYDGWSMDMLRADVSALLRRIEVPSRPQHQKLVEYHARNSDKDGFHDAARAFWSERLLRWNRTPFPKLAARPAASRTSNKIWYKVDLTPDFVRETAKIHNVTAQVFFQAALVLVWSRIMNEQDIVIGSVSSGRTIPVKGIERIMGPCMASLPLRVDISTMCTSLDLLRNIQASNRAAMEHCGLPLSEIKQIAGLQPAENLYDLLFVYQESPETAKGGHGLLEIAHWDRLETTLLLEIEPQELEYDLQITHQSSVSADFVDEFASQIQSVLRNLLTNPKDSIQYSMRSLKSRNSEYNTHPQMFRGTPDLAFTFEEIAMRMPERPALQFFASLDDDLSKAIPMSYRDLNETANQIAHSINTQSSIGEVVAIIMNKSNLLYTSILAIVKTGSAYLPILPTTPLARVRNIFGQAGIKRCVVDSSSLKVFHFIEGVEFLNIDAIDTQHCSKDNMGVYADPSRLAYIIYTSGTTGDPKGIAITQMNILSNISHLQKIYSVSASWPRLLQACSHAFDVSVFEIFYAWFAGMCLCATTNDVLFEDIEESIRRMGITHLSLTPTVACLIDPVNVPKVEFLVTAGEPMTLAVSKQWGDRLWQGYGPSETTNICSVKRMMKGENIEHLGWVLPNTSVVVLAPDTLDAIPIGWVGEFCFGGDQVAQGYHKNFSLSSKSFLLHPQFGRIYRSGDIGRMLPDGSLSILGRLDDQIKLRGQRIELNEINGIITSNSVTRAAITMLVRRETGTPDQLASLYVSPNSSTLFEFMQVDQETNRLLFSNIQSRVPSYMVPSYLLPVSYIPHTPSGKIDTAVIQEGFKKLPSHYLETGSFTTQVVDNDSEWSDIEISIADVISRTKGICRSDLGRWTPFAAVGIDSISAIDTAKELSSQLQVQISISTILLNPSIAQLGKAVEDNKPGLVSTWQEQLAPAYDLATELSDQVRNSFSYDRNNIEDILPCTPLQEAMLSRGQGSYCTKILLRVRIPAADMARYWDEMLRRHVILRTCFVTTKNVTHPIVQVVLQRFEITIQTHEVQAPSLAGAIHEHLATIPEPLDSGHPPLSLAFFRYNDSEFLSFICHHALYDGVAMECLWREVEALANGRTLLPPVPYKPFLQQSLIFPDDTDSFWTEQFRSFRHSILFPRSASGEINQSTHRTSLSMSLHEVQARLTLLGTSLLAACQASWATVLSVLCNHADIAFGNVVSGRTLDMGGLDRLVAPCFNTIPIRMDISRSSQNIDLLRSFHHLNEKMLRYQFSSLRRIQFLANCHGRSLFDTLLLLQQPLKDMDERVWTLEEDSGNMDMALVCEIVPCPNLNSVVVNIHHDLGVVTGDHAANLADLFKHSFLHLFASPYSSPIDQNSAPTRITSGLEGLIRNGRNFELSDQKESEHDKWTGVEEKIRGALSELSQVPEARIFPNTSIFHLGLDSINAVQISSMLRRQGFNISATDVIECPSPAKLAKRIALSCGRAGNLPALEFSFEQFYTDVSVEINGLMNQGGVEAVLPCTSVQCAMLASFMQSGGQNYCSMLCYKVQSGINTLALLHAWKLVQRNHQMLRTGFVPVRHQACTFAMVRNSIGQTEEAVECFHAIKSSTFEPTSWKEKMRRIIMQKLHLPPWRVALVESGNGVNMYVLMHHALYDANSLDGILGGVADAIHGQVRRFAEVEPALAEMLSQSLNQQQINTRNFWEAKSENTVVNTFPVMTPLREQKSVLQTHETDSAISLKLLEESAKYLGSSVQAIIQAAWARVLSSYLGESSVVFGVTLSGRTSEATRVAPFPCITTVPVIAQNVESNREIIRAMMDYNSELRKHQFAPLSVIQKWLGHPGHPVFDTLVVYQKRGAGGTEQQPWSLSYVDFQAEYAVSLEVEPANENTIRLFLNYAPDVLPEAQARLLTRQFDILLEYLCREPDGKEQDLYRANILEFSITPPRILALPSPVRFLHEFVEQGSLAHPTRIALEFASAFKAGRAIKQTWTYREIDRIGNQAAHLVNYRAAPGSIVAIHFEKCPEAYFAILGILKAGCSFVALDPNAPKARKDFILRDSNAVCLMTNTYSTIDFNIPIAGALLKFDTISLEQYPDRCLDLGAEFSTNNTCYCLYTSGTTGEPKGCEITHENAVQAMMAFQELFKGHWDDEARWLQFAALHFDVSVLEQYWSWSVGITVVAAPKDLILDDLSGSISMLEITHIDLTPSLARLTHPDDTPTLCKGVFITGGESLNQEILDTWGSKAVIYNAYGPTEATIGVTMYPRVPINGRPSNIGKQFPNVGSYVFRPGTDIPVLRGGVGELCISGKLVGKGYLNRPELTEQRFPTVVEFGERIYRTGDLVRILHDGCFDFLGRNDDQVKLRGQRLEIGEINHVIRHGAQEVQDAATIVVRPISSGRDILVSFLVGQLDRSQKLCTLFDTDGLGAKARLACLKQLPAYMVPSYFLRLPYIPLSSNEKVNFKELKDLFESLSHDQLSKLVSAATPLDMSQFDQQTFQKVINILTDFGSLKHDSISSSSSIFDIGVDSVAVLQLSAMFKSQGFDAASPVVLLRHHIVADLVRVLSEKSNSEGQLDLVLEAQQYIKACSHRYRPLVCRELGVTSSEIEYIAPCSPLQHGIISKAMTCERRGMYFNSFLLKLKGDDISIEMVYQAWTRLVESHAILRSAFVNTSDGYIQVALKHPPSVWSDHWVSSEGEADEILKSRRHGWIADNSHHIRTPLQLIQVQGPGFRRIVVHMFHSLYDGNSLELMNQYAMLVYRNNEEKLGPRFVEALAYGPLWNYDHCRDFWTQYLKGWVFSPVLTSLDVPFELRTVSATRFISLERFEDMRRQQTVTLQSVVLAVWASILRKHLGSSLTIGILVSGRSINLPDVENTIGPMFNTIPYFIKTLAGHTWGSLIRAVHKFSTSILPFQHVPLQSIQKWCSIGRPLFDNLFTFQVELPQASDDLPWTILDSHGQLDYPLSLEVIKTRTGLLKLNLVSQNNFTDSKMLEELLNKLEMAIDTAHPNDMVDPSAVDYVDLVSTTLCSNVSGDNFTAINIPLDWSGSMSLVRDEIAFLAEIPVQNITENTTLLELGLDSIDIMKLSMNLKKRGIDIPASKIMRFQKIPRFMQEQNLNAPDTASTLNDTFLQQIKQKLHSYVDSTGLDMRTVEAVLPPTPLQEAMVADMLQSNFGRYFNHDILEVAEGVDIQKLYNAWAQVVEKSPILRTGFVEVGDPGLDMTYCQVVFRNHTHMASVKLSNQSEIQTITESAIKLAIYGKGMKNLFQVTFATIQSRHFVVLSVAHALYDGWSLELMYQDLQAAYDGESCARVSAEIFISQMLASRTDEAQCFWASYLDGLSPTLLQGQKSPPVHDADQVFRKEMDSNETLSSMMNHCKNISVSLQVLCLACWAVAVAEWTHSLDVVFGVVLSGRDFEGAGELMFPTINTITMRCILHGSVREFLRYLEDSMADIRNFQAFPLRKAQAVTKVAMSDIFNSLFLVQKSVKVEHPSSKLLKSVNGTSAVNYPVCIEAEPVADRLRWRIACQSHFFSDEDTLQLIRNVNGILSYILQAGSEDILSFHEDNLSICGMPPIAIKDTAAQKPNATEEDFLQDGQEQELSETAKVIIEVLGQVSVTPVQDIKPSFSLYHLGLDSISAIKVSMLLRSRGIDIKPRELVNTSSISELARIAGLTADSADAGPIKAVPWKPPQETNLDTLMSACGLPMDDVEEILPAMPMQAFMLTHWQNTHGSVFFPEFRYRIDGVLDDKVIYNAWNKLLVLMPILRTRFISTGNQELPWLQCIFNADSFSSGRVSQPLIKLHVLYDKNPVLRVRIHHALYDGVSLPAMMSCFVGLLNDQCVVNINLPAWIDSCIRPTISVEQDKRRKFWIDYLKRTPSDSSESCISNSTETTSCLVESAIGDITRVRTIAARHGTSLQSLFLAAYAKSKARDRPSSAVFGLYLANRTRLEFPLPPTLPTLNLVPIKIQLREQESLLTIAREIQRHINAISSHGRADVGLWEIFQWTGVKVDSFVNFLSLPDEPSAAGQKITMTMMKEAGLRPASFDSATLLEERWLQNNAIRNAYPVCSRRWFFPFLLGHRSIK
ncbi:Amino acid adenylation [Drechmeria coniospora]|uniref:Amino acid adenylation n=1 Tax=Drechmeria coniospora TaxID=98403 RepID=A0A151GVM9_DRECN|nr:Amino acid adenylation [Drechmeria coniospora]KYK61154.1 Amino acid adenylation [Drechmeria coniospora]